MHNFCGNTIQEFILNLIITAHTAKLELGGLNVLIQTGNPEGRLVEATTKITPVIGVEIFGTTRVPAASNSTNLRLFETFDSSFGFYVHDFLAKLINGLQSTSNLSDFKLKCIKAFVGY